MMLDLKNFFHGVDPYSALLLYLLIFTRFLLMTIMMPFLGAQILPSMVRIGLASLLAILSFIPLLSKIEFLALDLNIFLIAALFLKEAIIGFVIGFLASLIFYLYQIVGEFVDFARAASMSKLFVPEIKHQSSQMGTFFFQLALVIFLSAGFHRPVIKKIYESFSVFEPLKLNPTTDNNVFFFGFEILSSLFSQAFNLALPIVFICFLIDFAFGLLNRVAPQINAYFLSLPAKIIGGLIMLFFVLPFLLDDFFEHHWNISRFFFQFIN